jgi:hypothetical protein
MCHSERRDYGLEMVSIPRKTDPRVWAPCGTRVALAYARGVDPKHNGLDDVGSFVVEERRVIKEKSSNGWREGGRSQFLKFH